MEQVNQENGSQVIQFQPASTNQQQELQTMIPQLPNQEQGDFKEKQKPIIEYKQYDPYCKEKQFNVLIGDVKFDVVNPPEYWNGDFGFFEELEDMKIIVED